ncbi:MAG: DUF4810 domain-containing protein [Bacteroidales bacterium]
MRKLLIIAASILFFASCTTQKPLYTWAKYGDASYNYLKNGDEKATQELIATYTTIIEQQKGSRAVVPPGVYADYGFVLLQANRTEEGRAMLSQEIALYPESKIFVERILKMTEE